MALWNWPLEFAGWPGALLFGAIAASLCLAPLFAVMVLFRRFPPWATWVLPPAAMLGLAGGLLVRGTGLGRDNTHGHLTSPALLEAAAHWEASAHLLWAIVGMGVALYGLTVSSTVALALQRLPSARRQWLNASLTLAFAVVGSLAMVGSGMLLGANTLDALSLAVLQVAVGSSTALAVLPRCRDARLQRRVSRTALAVWATGTLAFLGGGAVAVHGGLTAALGAKPYSPEAIAAGWTQAPYTVAMVMVGTTFLFAIGGFVTIHSRRWMSTGRGIASSAVGLTALAAGIGSAWLAPRTALAELQHVVQHGAIQAISPGLFNLLPRARDMAETPVDASPVTGSCLVQEAAAGWTTQPVFAGTDPQARLAAQLPDSAPEALRTARCTPTRAPLDGVFSPGEVPIITVAGDRAATTLSSEGWFAERGLLQVMVRDAEVPGEHESEALRRLTAAAVDFRWEVPPEIDPPEDLEPGVWNAAHAAQLPVTLIEGPYTVLVVDGQRSRLPAGELGRETLELVLSSRSPEARDLVLVPRKNWTVNTLVELCLSGQAVPSTVCLIRPETSVRWALRTHLPLPW